MFVVMTDLVQDNGVDFCRQTSWAKLPVWCWHISESVRCQSSVIDGDMFIHQCQICLFISDMRNSLTLVLMMVRREYEMLTYHHCQMWCSDEWAV